MTKHTTEIIRRALDLVKPRFRLPLHHGEHGIAHWVRVWGNAEALCDYYHINPAVPCWFAFLHDSMRENENRDPDHGRRAARLAQFHSGLLELDSADLTALQYALSRHSDGHNTCPSIQVRICWDADRLDLGRCGIVPDPARLCTERAREMIPASYARSIRRAG